MSTVDVEVIAKNFANYLKKVEGGEIILIAAHDRPVAELRPAPKKMDAPRPFGLCAGQFVVPDDFDAPLPDDITVVFFASGKLCWNV